MTQKRTLIFENGETVEHCIEDERNFIKSSQGIKDVDMPITCRLGVIAYAERELGNVGIVEESYSFVLDVHGVKVDVICEPKTRDRTFMRLVFGDSTVFSCDENGALSCIAGLQAKARILCESCLGY